MTQLNGPRRGARLLVAVATLLALAGVAVVWPRVPHDFHVRTEYRPSSMVDETVESARPLRPDPSLPLGLSRPADAEAHLGATIRVFGRIVDPRSGPVSEASVVIEVGGHRWAAGRKLGQTQSLLDGTFAGTERRAYGR